MADAGACKPPKHVLAGVVGMDGDCGETLENDGRRLALTVALSLVTAGLAFVVLSGLLG